MDHYLFTYKTDLPVSLEEAWAFFSNPNNLARIQTFPPVNVSQEGDSILIRVPYTGNRIQFKTTIFSESPPHEFKDKMENPPFPFSYWEHTHQFVKGKDGTIMIDHVCFASVVPASLAAKGLTLMFKSREKQVNNHLRP
ncbi:MULTISPECIES: SRPBCC family protein [Shouchella]|uniref:SRPBCC family protein n=2 Tax=Shouchella TaxID=2893057 RepID=A0ABY7W3F9_9BACI|nr:MULTISPECIES: hypothetical protein [Shouchella]MED4127966.1 hypothetical protein [Shouchella miscanthi]WDF03111.1 hypothetical protein PQ477_16680 [Shouchella hunanensis]